MSQERPIRLHAGPWSVEFEKWSGWVRCIRLGGIEVVRAAYAVVRGDSWQTYSQRITTSHVSQEDGRFLATWRSELDDLDFAWEGKVSCDGVTLEVEVIGESGQSFQTRRTGLCVLHPREVQGLPCAVEHTNGSQEEGAFPSLIEPQQPFFDVKSIEHQVGDAQVRFEFKGEVFEMEDQRNWTDVSFKTYCRPQEWPQPYAIQPGDQVHHGFALTYTGQPQSWTPQCRTLLTSSQTWTKIPKVGCLAQSDAPDFDFVIHPDRPADWSATGLGRLHHTGGFVDLNRDRPAMSDFDGVAFGATPQVHAFDERSIMENVHGLRDVVLTAREIAGGKAVAVGPLVFKNRRQEWDDRLEMNLGEAWLLASLAILSEAGADAVCALQQGDYSDGLRKVVGLMRSAKEIRMMNSDGPYRAIGFEFGDPPKAVLINLRPYATSVHYRADYELEPYEILVLG